MVKVPALAVRQLAPCASSAGRTWRLWANRYVQNEAQPLGAQPRLQGLKRAASKVADLTAFTTQAKHKLVVGWNNWPEHATATFGLQLWPPQCRPQVELLGRFKGDFKGANQDARDDWWDVAEMPPPHPFRFNLPVNRGCMRRILRDQQGWLDRIKLKPQFQVSSRYVVS